VALGEISAGGEMIQIALDIRTAKLPSDHWLMGESMYAQAMVRYIQQQPDPALTQQACDILQDKKGDANFMTRKCITLLQKITDMRP